MVIESLFLWPEGSAMNMAEYWSIDVFGSGLVLSIQSLIQIGQYTLKL